MVRTIYYIVVSLFAYGRRIAMLLEAQMQLDIIVES